MLSQQNLAKKALIAKVMILLLILSTSLAQPHQENLEPADFPTTLSQNVTSAGFPKFLWTFWDGNLQNPNTEIFLKLCLHNMNEYAGKSGWEFNLVTYNNLEKYLSKQNYERCMRLLERVGSSFKQVRADIIRLLLLKQNGGMWVDSSTFFVEKLDWINNIAYEPLSILNRFQSYPQLLTFRMQDYDKPNPWIFDEELNQTVNVSPGIENWGIIAKPNTAFINDSLDIIEEISMKGQSYIQNKIASNGVQLSTYANNSYFKFGIYTFQIVLQLKQKQLNSRYTEGIANQLHPIKYAVDFYKIWTLSGETIGFGLEKITDGITPFLSFVFLSTDAKLIDAYEIKLRGFVKLGGIKRKYMEMILQKLTNTQMCSIVLEDAFKLTNRSFLYKHLIADNEEHTGLVLKDHINNMEKYRADKTASCKVSAGQEQMFLSLSKNVNYTFVWICIFVGILLVLALYYIKIYHMLKITHKIIFLTGLGLALALLVFSISFTTISPSAREQSSSSLTKSNEAGISYSFQTRQMTEDRSILSQSGICSSVIVQQDASQLLITNQYHADMKSRLPADNGTFLQMLFDQKILKHQDDFSSFVGLNKWVFVGYFSEYFVGILLFVAVLAAHKWRKALIFQRIAQSKLISSILKILRMLIFVFLFCLALGAFWKCISLKSSVQTSICYFAKIPSYLQSGQESMQKAVTEGQFIDTIASQFESISFTMIAMKSAFTGQTDQYQKELITIKQNAGQSNNQQLFQLLQNKQEVLSNLQKDILEIVDSLVCENRIILGFKLAYDNIRNMLQKLVYFFDNFLSIKTLSYLSSSVLITVAFIFCLFSSIFLVKSLKKKNLAKFSQRRSLLILGLIGLFLSFTLNCFVLTNYYLCDFLAQYKSSLEKSSDFFMNILPKPCMSSTLSDLFVQDIDQNFERRHQPFRDFLSISEQMDQIAAYPFDKEKELLSSQANSNNAIDHFVASSQEYNKMLQRICKSYGESKGKVEAALDKNYLTIPNVNFVGKLETVLFQPLCTFNFNVLYEITSYFTYLGLFNLIAFFVSLLHDHKTSSKDSQIDLLAGQGPQFSQKDIQKVQKLPDQTEIVKKDQQLQQI